MIATSSCDCTDLGVGIFNLRILRLNEPSLQLRYRMPGFGEEAVCTSCGSPEIWAKAATSGSHCTIPVYLHGCTINILPIQFDPANTTDNVMLQHIPRCSSDVHIATSGRAARARHDRITSLLCSCYGNTMGKKASGGKKGQGESTGEGRYRYSTLPAQHHCDPLLQFARP